MKIYWFDGCLWLKIGNRAICPHSPAGYLRYWRRHR